MSIDRVTAALDAILGRIYTGEFPVGEALPPEVDLAALLDVSRPTMREAVRALSTRGVLRVEHGRGTFVNPVPTWTDLPTMIEALNRTESPRQIGLQLIELRRMIEVGACGLAARNRSDEDVTELSRLLAAYTQAEEAGDIDAVARNDLAFHSTILKASTNPFLPAILLPLQEALSASRRRTSSDPRIRERATYHHHAILDAIRDRDEARAKDAMRAHMTQTRDDIAAHLSDTRP
ncbi:FadR/GntR family transcriptional regulator [Flaviflexus huanghaiensis]|uniref:FadR/GntR family transcriptional regulator n=1 Tax=Flaviflexus huanghaiensis TaxID=1111473 RepID=UPI0015FBD30D|nr:FadR/GntR family transcriptional regulator [Flaviflexus huanghaiensis]